MICSTIGRLRTVRRSKGSGCWARAGRRDPTNCGIFWRATTFRTSGSTSRFPRTIRKPSGCWKLLGRRHASLPVVLFPDGTKLLESVPARVAQKVGLRTRAQTRFLRSGDCRRRAGRSGGRGLWRVRRSAHGDDRARSARRPGGHEFAHRKLSGISDRAQRRRSGAARGGAGAAVRSGNSGAAGSGRRPRRKGLTASSSWRMATKFPATR